MAELVIKRRWLRCDVLTLPSGTVLRSSTMVGAFDCGFPCPYCRSDLQGLYVERAKTAPSGVATPHWERVGAECVHCQIGSTDGADGRSGSDWLPLVEFLRTQLPELWGAP